MSEDRYLTRALEAEERVKVLEERCHNLELDYETMKYNCEKFAKTISKLRKELKDAKRAQRYGGGREIRRGD